MPERLASPPRPEDRRDQRPSLARIIEAVGRLEQGEDVAPLAATLAVTANDLERWRERYRNVRPAELGRLERLERENARLTKLVEELRLDKYMLQQLLRDKR